MVEKKKKELKKIDEKQLEDFNIRVEEKKFIFTEKNVKIIIGEDEEKNIYYVVYNSDNKKIAIVDSNNKIKFSKDYKEMLGDKFELLGLDSKKIEVDVATMIKEKEENNKENKNKEDKYNKENEKNNNKEVKNDKDKEDLEEENKEEKQNISKEKHEKNKEVRKKIKEENSEEITDNEIQKYERVQIKDKKFAENLVDSNDVDLITVMVCMVNNRPKLMVKYNGADYYKVIESRSEKDAGGEIDSIEHGKEYKQKKGKQISYNNKSGSSITLDVQRDGAGQLEVRYIDDLNKDGKSDGIKLETNYYASSQSASKIKNETDFDRKNGLDNQEKENMEIDTLDDVEETYTGSLSNDQIKKILDEKNLPEKQRREVISIIERDFPSEENPTKEKLNEIIDSVTRDIDEDEIEYDEDEHVHEHVHKGGPSWV